ncbi:MAG: peptidase [Nocardioidaceae bacterium]|nr:peptidase [Nocardioidaceae bacterium]
MPAERPLHETTSFPRLYARTQRFTLGVPRALSVTADGSRVLFLRTASGTSPTGSLWAYDVADGEERCLADPASLLSGEEELSAEERARRERSREAGSGVVAYATDRSGRVAAFALSGRLWLCDVHTGRTRELPAAGPVLDPRPDPTGRHVAYASGRALHVVGADGRGERALVGPEEHPADSVGSGSDAGTVVWGQAEFVAAEDMDRTRGYWWAPDGESLLVERYDELPVPVWYVSDPAHPERPPAAHRYPAAGTANADVSLWVVRLDGSRTQVEWDAEALPYFLRAEWSSDGDPLIQVMTRDQATAQVLSVDPSTGRTTLVRELRDPVWVDAVQGVPLRGPGGRAVWTEDVVDVRRVVVDGRPVGDPRWYVRAVLGADDRGVLVSASEEPTELHLVRIGWDGRTTALTSEPGVHTGASAGGTTVVASGILDDDGVRVRVLRDGEDGPLLLAELANHQVHAGFRPAVRMIAAGPREIRTAVLFPRSHVPGSRRLPVLMYPYAGPHAQRAVAASRAHLESQWLADQGFVVVVADGRGTPGRGAAWDRAVRDHLVAATLDDQVAALEAVAAAHPDDLDTSRVGITGWSYGGYLAAYAVLARPDVFAAAVAGAPVTDQRLYDTFYTERYLGHPDEQPEVYERNSLLAIADRLDRPLMLIHGMVDDNVVVAHTLRLSAALLAAGRPHTVLPLTGVTHMASQEEVAENLRLLQVDFLRTHLAG